MTRRRECRHSDHRRLCADPTRFRAETVFHAVWETPHGTLELRHCICASTLSIVLPRAS